MEGLEYGRITIGLHIHSIPLAPMTYDAAPGRSGNTGNDGERSRKVAAKVGSGLRLWEEFESRANWACQQTGWGGETKREAQDDHGGFVLSKGQGGVNINLGRVHGKELFGRKCQELGFGDGEHGRLVDIPGERSGSEVLPKLQCLGSPGEFLSQMPDTCLVLPHLRV